MLVTAWKSAPTKAKFSSCSIKPRPYKNIWTWRGEFGPLKINTTTECLVYPTKSINNENVWQQVEVLAGRQELSLSTVKRRKL